MRSLQLLHELKFRESEPVAEPLFVDKEGRILRFCLQPHQGIAEHTVPNSPFYVVILKGHGMFSDGKGEEIQLGPNSLMVFNPGETHAVRALDEELVFVGFLQGVAGAREERVGGVMGDA